MKELVDVVMNGENLTIGYKCMMAPTALRETGRVFQMLRLSSKVPEQEGDIFFFEYVNCQWLLLPEFCFINLDGPAKLQDLYQKLNHLKRITWDDFIQLLFRHYYYIE